MISTLQRYFGMRFLTTLVAVLLGVFALIVLLDYVESMRRMADVPNVSALLVAKISLYRVPQIGERILPFCVLIGAMSCFLGLSRRLELVVSRAAGMSAWQFTAPAIVVALGVGIFATTVFNPIAAVLQERSKRMEAEVSGNSPEGLQATVNGFWVSQRSDNNLSVLNAAGSRDQGVVLTKVSAFVFDQANHFLERIEANTAVLEAGHWRLDDAHVYAPGKPPIDREAYLLATNLTAQRESLASDDLRRPSGHTGVGDALCRIWSSHAHTASIGAAGSGLAPNQRSMSRGARWGSSFLLVVRSLFHPFDPSHFARSSYPSGPFTSRTANASSITPSPVGPRVSTSPWTPYESRKSPSRSELRMKA